MFQTHVEHDWSFKFRMSKTIIGRMTETIQNPLLARDIYKSIARGLNSSFVHMNGRMAWLVFKASLDAAIRDIENHPRGHLFRRLIEYGPPGPDHPKKPNSDGKTHLSDPECGQAVQFIFSHMINRFKGELAELLAIRPCLELVEKLQQSRGLPKGVELYFGDTIQEHRQISSGNKKRWSGLAKGADGLIVKVPDKKNQSQEMRLSVHGVIEVKSMPLPRQKLIKQIELHLRRLTGGVKLGENYWEKKQLSISNPLSIMVIPSTWKISREWSRKDTETGWELVFPDSPEPPLPTRFEEIQPNQWLITLDWSKEALEQAAYEMTFWYMSQVGKVIYAKKPLPKEWKGMTPEEAGFNSIKMMLYYLILRYISKYQGQRAIKLYNAYSFGYPLAVDAKDMLWPEDFSDRM
jgi:hypothetical protein